MILAIKKHIENLPLTQTCRNEILGGYFEGGKSTIFVDYPILFSKAFEIQEEDLDLLGIAGFLYYRATLFLDLLIDEKEFSKVFVTIFCQEEATKIFTLIYGLNSSFWKVWNTRKEEYFDAVVLEKEFSKRANVSIEEYEILVDKKSAFAKAAIDSLFCLDCKRNELQYQKLLRSHNYFFVALQLQDDLKDFKEDTLKGQFNWACYLLQQQNLGNLDIKELEKYLYIRGISKQMYQLATLYLDKALQEVEHIDVPKWKAVLIKTKNIIEVAMINVEKYLDDLIVTESI